MECYKATGKIAIYKDLQSIRLSSLIQDLGWIWNKDPDSNLEKINYKIT